MLTKLSRKKVERQDDTRPTNIEQVIEKYNLEKLWDYIDTVTDTINNEQNTIDNLQSIIDNAILERDMQKYHVGKIIIETSNTNPATYLGFGTWQYWGSGRVPVGVDTSDTDFNTSEQTGGSKYLQSHTHRVGVPWSQSGSIGSGYPIQQASQNYYNYQGGSAIMEEAGTGNSGNLQPYITCYMWKRVA